jgi:peptidoglycan/LPS O-acetylase OafA/YrhL
MTRPGTRLVGLDALRGMAALFVTLLHLDGLYEVPSYFEHADLMVDFFFMLSGYIMARTYEGRLGHGLDAVHFFNLRFRRLWPPLAVGVAIGAALRLGTGYPMLDVVILLMFGLLLLPNQVLAYDPFDLNPPQWSVTLELVANVLHASFLWRVGLRALLGVALLSGLIMWFWPTGFRDHPNLSFWLVTARVLLPYCIGIAIWRLLGDRPRLPFAVAFLGLPAIMMGCWLIWPDGDMTYYVPIVAFLLPVVLIAGLGCHVGGRIGQVAAFAGALSFPLYAVHHPTIKIVQLAGGPQWLALLVSLIVSMIVSALLEKRSARKRRRNAPATSRMAI